MKRFLLFLIFVSLLFAHGGKTDSNGGHYDRKTGTYHYHRSKAYKQTNLYPTRSKSNNNFNLRIKEQEKQLKNKILRKSIQKQSTHSATNRINKYANKMQAIIATAPKELKQYYYEKIPKDSVLYTLVLQKKAEPMHTKSSFRHVDSLDCINEIAKGDTILILNHAIGDRNKIMHNNTVCYTHISAITMSPIEVKLLTRIRRLYTNLAEISP